MRDNLTSINVIIDRSGSMAGLVADTIGGFNTFLKDQKSVEGDAICTLCLFDHEYQLIHDCKTLAEVQDLDDKTYSPRGSTALLDAVGATINSVGAKLAAMNEEDRPSKVIFLIITDGAENASKDFTKDKIAEMIKHQEEVYKWNFVFMGANMDAFSEAASLGIRSVNALTYAASAAGTKSLYGSVSNNMGHYRRSKAAKVDFFNQPEPPKDENKP